MNTLAPQTTLFYLECQNEGYEREDEIHREDPRISFGTIRHQSSAQLIAADLDDIREKIRESDRTRHVDRRDALLRAGEKDARYSISRADEEIRRMRNAESGRREREKRETERQGECAPNKERTTSVAEPIADAPHKGHAEHDDPIHFGNERNRQHI